MICSVLECHLRENKREGGNRECFLISGVMLNFLGGKPFVAQRSVSCCSWKIIYNLLIFSLELIASLQFILE